MANAPASVYATVVFLRIPEFARRPATEQARLRAQLESALAVAIADMGEESRIVLDAADGIVLAVLGDPRAALRVTQQETLHGSAQETFGAVAGRTANPTVFPAGTPTRTPAWALAWAINTTSGWA